MPHFVIHCSNDILNLRLETDINKEVHDVANATGLFDEADIKIRILTFKEYLVGGKRASFIHVFANIMEGRSSEQRAKLSKAVVVKLVELFPNVPNVAMNIDEFQANTYYNKALLT